MTTKIFESQAKIGLNDTKNSDLKIHTCYLN